MRTVLDWLSDSFPEVSPKMFYRGIFPEGELEKAGEYVTGKYTGIIVAITGDKKQDGKRKVLRYSLTDDLGAVDTAVNSENFCLCSPISYAGKQRTAEHARFVYAIAIDVDKIRMKPDGRTGEPEGLRDLYHQMYHDTKYGRYLPVPTYMVGSGSGLHLYYVLETPLPLYHEIAKELQKLKRELTRKVWNGYVVNITEQKEIQQEGIYQGFRMPGTVTKTGGRAKAFLTGERVTIEYLNSFVSDECKARTAEAYKRAGKIRLAEAKEKFPEWYEKRVVRKEAPGAWAVNRAVYDHWKKEIYAKATVGHRYYCLMTLAMYAQKCSHYDAKKNPNPVTQEELEKDCFALFDRMEGLTTEENNHFSNDDILAALEAFNERWTKYPRAAIEYKTAIAIPQNKRNGRKQDLHLRIARGTLATLNGEGKALQGRKSKYDIVEYWKGKNPEGTIKECIEDTGLSIATVYRHWKKAEETEEEKRKAEEAAKVAALAKQAREMSAAMRSQIEAAEETAEKMRVLLESMPEGAERVKYQVQYDSLTAKGLRSRRKAGNRRRDFRARKSPAGTSEGQNRPQSAATGEK